MSRNIRLLAPWIRFGKMTKNLDFLPKVVKVPSALPKLLNYNIRSGWCMELRILFSTNGNADLASCVLAVAGARAG